MHQSHICMLYLGLFPSALLKLNPFGVEFRSEGNVVSTATDASYSIVLLYSAMAVYAVALVAYTWDLARRAADRSTVPAAARVLSMADTAGAPSPVEVQAPPPSTAPVVAGRASSSARLAFRLTTIAWILHAGAVVFRGIGAGRVPWADMYEYSMTSTLIIIGIFLIAQKRLKLEFLGTFVVGLMLILLAVGTVGFYVAVVPLPPALQSAWLVIHVLVAMTATAFFALSFALSALTIARDWKDHGIFFREGSDGVFSRMLAKVPALGALDRLAYRITIIGFILWTFTLMAGAIWAQQAWGRYWGWDTKEVWTFIVWVIYAAYIHAKATRGWTGTRAAWLAIIGFSAVMFNFGIVNIFFKGLHSYSGL